MVSGYLVHSSLARGRRISGWLSVPRAPALRSPGQPPYVTPLQHDSRFAYAWVTLIPRNSAGNFGVFGNAVNGKCGISPFQ